jgi:membrane-associated protease RseP (regulator of RpoE activity)
MAKHIILFVLTAVSTYFVAARYSFDPKYFVEGISYSASIMTILLAHEMGHYTMSRRYGVPATLPYFIPFPFSPFGTFGAIIKMKGIIINKKALFDIGVAGPLMSFILSVPCLVFGMRFSRVVPIDQSLHDFRLGEPLLLKLIQRLTIGELPPNYDVMLHPLGYAGWVGLFVTALNLLPVGQLDGGHVVYAVFGQKSRWAFAGSILALVVLALFYNPGWIALIILLLIFGMRHPQPFDSETPLDRPRKVLACLMLVIFILSFTPAPFPGISLFGK